MNQILKRQTSRSHYGSKVPVVTITVFKYRNKIGKIVVKAKGSMITAADGQKKMITRNSSHFKKVGESIMNEEESEEILDGNNSDTPDITLRRSPRERRPPKYLNDYVCSK